MEIKNIVNPWRTILLAQMASFRGVVFHVETGSRSSGRRTVVHEFPKRNDPYAEDMGRQARRFQFTGYLIYRPSNPRYEYTNQRKRLIEVLEENDIGQLVHPVFVPGGMQAMCERYSMSESRERGGYTTFEMSFVESGSLVVSTGTDTKVAAQKQATASEQTATKFLALQLAPLIAPLPSLPIFVPAGSPDGGSAGTGDTGGGDTGGGDFGGSSAPLTVISDVNVTGAVNGNEITLGWAGLLSPARGGFGVDLSTTGGISRFLKQNSVGGPVTVERPTSDDVTFSTGAVIRNAHERILERGISVKDYGAIGDATANDTTAFQNAINAAAAAKCDVLVPYGLYKLLTGITISDAVRLIGTGGNTGAPVLWCGYNDITVVTLDGFRSGVQDLEIIGAGVGCTKPTLFITADAVEATVYDIRVWGGYHAIECRAPDVTIWNIHADASYGSAIVKLKNASGCYLYRCKIDHSEGNYPSPGVSGIDGWIANHNYSVNDFISIDGESWILQCTTAGQSGSSEPNAADYGDDIVDNAAHWKLVSPFNYSSLIFDNCYSCFAHGCDHSGLFTYGIKFTDEDSAGNGPEGIVIQAATCGQNWLAGIFIDAGSGITISDCILAGTFLELAAGIWINDEGTDVGITGNLIFQNPVGILHASGENVTIAGSNRISGAVIAAILVASDVIRFSIVGNSLGTGHWGPNAYPVYIDTGSSNYFIVMGNQIVGGSNPIHDASTGSNKTITGNQ